MSENGERASKNGEEDEDRIPYQMDVYFDDFPDIDPEALARFVNETDPDEADTCTVEFARDNPGGEIRQRSYVAEMGDFRMTIMVHNVPSPAAEIIEHAPLPEAFRERARKHRSFALLSHFGGENYAPYENLIFLYKVAIGLCRQGAIGVSPVHLGLCFPGDFLIETLQFPAEVMSDETLTLWKCIREEHEPFQLLAQIGGFESGGKRYLCTNGYSFCGFPDFVYACEGDEDADDVADLFRDLFDYLMDSGPCIQAGHTMGYDEDVAFRFHEAPGDIEFPFKTYQMLLVTRERAA